jgi:hypothetical protein
VRVDHEHHCLLSIDSLIGRSEQDDILALGGFEGGHGALDVVREERDPGWSYGRGEGRCVRIKIGPDRSPPYGFTSSCPSYRS